jgi:hypothetical protein
MQRFAGPYIGIAGVELQRDLEHLVLVGLAWRQLAGSHVLLESLHRTTAPAGLGHVLIHRQIAAEIRRMTHVQLQLLLQRLAEEPCRFLEHPPDQRHRHGMIDHGEEPDLAAGVIDLFGHSVDCGIRGSGQRRKVDYRHFVRFCPAADGGFGQIHGLGSGAHSRVLGYR